MPTKRRDIVRKVRKFDGDENEKRGKGSHRLLVRPDPDNLGRQLKCSLPYHGSNQDFPDSAVNSIRRKLKLDSDSGVSDEEWDAA